MTNIKIFFKIDPNPDELLECVQKGLQKGKLAAST